MRFVTGQFPLHNGVLLMITIKVNPAGQWGKNLVMAMGFVDHFGQCSTHQKVSASGAPHKCYISAFDAMF